MPSAGWVRQGEAAFAGSGEWLGGPKASWAGPPWQHLWGPRGGESTPAAMVLQWLGYRCWVHLGWQVPGAEREKRAGTVTAGAVPVTVRRVSPLGSLRAVAAPPVVRRGGGAGGGGGDADVAGCRCGAPSLASHVSCEHQGPPGTPACFPLAPPRLVPWCTEAVAPTRDTGLRCRESLHPWPTECTLVYHPRPSTPLDCRWRSPQA